MPTSATGPNWTPGSRVRLRQTLEQAGHSQSDCAKILVRDFELARATQADVSRWISGAVRTPRCADQLVRYCDAYGPAAIDPDASDGPTDPLDSAFEEILRGISGEPELGELQRLFVIRLTDRLAGGPPMSPADRASILDLIGILGLHR